MSEGRVEISRPLVAILAATCLAASLVLWLCWPDHGIWYGSFLRVGVLMVVFWLALPARGRRAAWAGVSPWAIAGIVAVLLLLPQYKRSIIPLAIVVAIAAVILRPRKRGRPPGPA